LAARNPIYRSSPVFGGEQRRSRDKVKTALMINYVFIIWRELNKNYYGIAIRLARFSAAGHMFFRGGCIHLKNHKKIKGLKSKKP